MPYPHSNKLGKNPPPGSAAAKFVTYSYKKEPPSYHGLVDQIDAQVKANAKAKWNEEQLQSLFEISEEKKAEQQKKMMEQLQKEISIKFPNVTPAIQHKDYGNHPASKYGKADLSAIPDAGPYQMPGSVEEQAAHIRYLLSAGLITKEKAYELIVGKSPELAQQFAKPKPKHFYGFTKQAPLEQDAYEIHMKFKIDGLVGVDGATLNASQMVAKQFIVGANYTKKDAVEQIVDDMLRQIKVSIMEQIKKAK